MRRLALTAVSALLAVSAVAAPVAARSADNSIVDAVLANDGEFDILQAAVIEAGLVGALSRQRQLTVFAPTDQAFIDTFDGLLDADLSEQDVIDFIDAGGVDTAFGDGALARILLYHVAPGARDSADVLSSERIRTLGKGFLYPSVDGGTPYINDAEIVAPDMVVSNGVIHVIDSVLIP